MLQPEFYYFILKLADSSDNLPVTRLLYEKLGHSLIGHLPDTLIKLLGFHRIQIIDFAQDLRRKTRDSFKMQQLTFGKGVSYFEITAVVQSNYITGVRLLNNAFAISHKACRRRKPHLFF